MSTNISCEYDQYFRPAAFRVTRKFQDMQNLIHPARRVTIDILVEYQRFFEAWASNARLLYGNTNRFYEVQRKLEGLEATLSNEITRLTHRDPGAANQYETILSNAMDHIKASMDSLGNPRPFRAVEVESSRTGRRQRTRLRQIY